MFIGINWSRRPKRNSASVPLWHNKDKSENPCGATGWLVCPYSFSTKNGSENESTGGGEKPGLHLKDKFFQTTEEVKNWFLWASR